ncbi:hypothetical protein QJS10_CPB17g00904 [Acorus calamus]|uniref:Glycine-rich protein n=1 Tax=Acorus calamus TaxID=4465 RepID=A0AAV9CT95_ACOCL|nr:hypothetical protein QJS10_CPB17g00904 [Acorus calamus]
MAWSHKLVLVLAISAAAFIRSPESRSLKSELTITPMKEVYQPQTVGIFAPPGMGLGGLGGGGGIPDAGALPGFGGMPGMIGGGFPSVGGNP